MHLKDLFNWGGDRTGTWDALRCPKCGTVYRVGDNAQISTWELVLETMGRSGVSYGNTPPGHERDDLIKTASDLDSIECFSKVREAVAAGYRRRWQCGNCKQHGIKYPRKVLPAVTDEVEQMVIKQLAYQFERLKQTGISGSTLDSALKVTHVNLARISAGIRECLRRCPPDHLSLYDHRNKALVMVTFLPWPADQAQRHLLDPNSPPMGYISLLTRILNAQPTGIDYQLIHCVWCASEEGVQLHIAASGVGPNLGKLPSVLPRQLLNDDERRLSGV